jgi:hypothetical protein
VPDLLRRVIGLGFSGLFMTEEVLRKALGDTLPKEWVEFAIEQSERTRRELVERVASEIGRLVDGVDPAELLERLVRGHELEVTARVRLRPGPVSDEASRQGGASLRVAFERDGEEG